MPCGEQLLALHCDTRFFKDAWDTSRPVFDTLPWCRILAGVYIALFSEIQFRFSLNITSSYVKKQHLGQGLNVMYCWKQACRGCL